MSWGDLRGSVDVTGGDGGGDFTQQDDWDGYLMAANGGGRSMSTDNAPIDSFGRVNFRSGIRVENGRIIAPDGTDMGASRGGGGMININIRDGQGSNAGFSDAELASIRQENMARMQTLAAQTTSYSSSYETGVYSSDPGSIEYYQQRGGDYRVELSGMADGVSNGQIAQQNFRRMEIEQMNAAASNGGFNAAEVDSQIIKGSYNSFSAVGGALADGRFADAWQYASYTPSQQARDAAYARVYPQQTLVARQLDVLANGGPFATAGYLMAKARGASPEGQLSASTFGGGLDGVFGAFGGVTAAGNGNRLAFTGVQPGFGGISAPVTQASVSYGPSYSLKTKADGTVLYRFGKSSHGITADLTSDGVLSIEAQASTSMSMRSRYGTGTQMYNQMMEAIGPQNVKQINGIWSRGSGLTTNLEQFESNYALTGDKFGAAAQTWSGKRAEGYGFKPAIVDITPDGPRVIFRRP